MPYIILHFLGFFCVRDAGRRGNKITVSCMVKRGSLGWLFYAWLKGAVWVVILCLVKRGSFGFLFHEWLKGAVLGGYFMCC